LFCCLLSLFHFSLKAKRVTPCPSWSTKLTHALEKKSSVFSIDLLAKVPKTISATFDARILAPDDKVLAAASVPVQLSSTLRRFEVRLNWVPVNGFEDASSSRLFYEVHLERCCTPAIARILSPYG
jgi:hypothetical protein